MSLFFFFLHFCLGFVNTGSWLLFFLAFYIALPTIAIVIVVALFAFKSDSEIKKKIYRLLNNKVRTKELMIKMKEKDSDQ